MEKIAGYLEIGITEKKEVVINLPNLPTDEHGQSHVTLSPRQAKNLALLLLQKAIQAELQVDQQKQEGAAPPQVDRSSVTLANGSPVTDDHRELQSNGQQRGYVVLSAEERAKGFVRPVRTTYRHLACRGVTKMGRSIAETYARDPAFYGGTFCVNCGEHFPLLLPDGKRAFVWIDDETGVGE